MMGLRGTWLVSLFIALASSAWAAEPVDVRFGDHKGHSRAVFHWSKKVDYRLEEAPGKVIVHFERAGDFDLTNHRERGPRAIPSVAVTKDQRSVVLVAPSGKVHKSFRLGNRIVIDVAMAGTPSQKTRPQKTVVRDDVRKKASPQAKPAAKSKPSKSIAKSQPTGALSGDAVRVTWEKRPGRAITRFEWPTETGLAALHRGGHIWLGFSDARAIDLSQISQGGHGPLVNIVNEPSTIGTLVRIDIAAGAALDISREGQTWIVDIGGGRGRAEQVVAFETQAESEEGPRIFSSLIAASEPMIVDDPLIGDRIVLVPVTETGLGVRPARSFVKLDLPATPQGVAVRFKSLDLTVKANGRGLSIGAGKTLHLAAEADERPALKGAPPKLAMGAAAGPVEGVLDFKGWRGDGQVIETRQKLMQRIVHATPAARNSERKVYARFLLAHGLGAEALGVMARIEEDDRRVVNDRTYRAQRGVARLMTGDYAGAASDLGHRHLKDAADVALFRGVLAERKRDFGAARRAFTQGWGILKEQPLDMQPMFRTSLAETALQLNDIEAVEEQIDKLALLSDNAAIQEQVQLLTARVQHRIGQTEEAESLFLALADSRQRDVRAKARFAETNLLLAENRITAREAVEQMERLRFAWRGDVFEFDLLKRLGELYIKTGNYRDGLVMMRRTIDQFPDLPEAQRLASDMNDVFATLFEGQYAEQMSPVTAMGLYYDFRELTPEGGRGDQMIQRLADRLAAEHLLDEAAKLLEHQVRHRLKGQERTRVGTRLAVLYLLDDKPRDAIDALRASRNLSAPEDLVRERRLLEARGQTELGRYERALALLNGLKGDDVNDVRTEILWRARKWQRAASSLGNRLVSIRATNGPLELAARQDVLRYAIASSLASDNAALGRLRGDFADRMQGHPEWPAFQVVTAADQRDSAEFRNLAAEIAQVVRFESFMTAYRDRLRDRPLSAIN